MNLIYIDRLPQEIIEFNIWPFISIYIKVWLNKENYLKFHNIISNNISNKDSYYRDMIRNDYKMVFNEILKENLNKWIIEPIQIHYNNIIFKDYLNYTNYLITKYKSNKCKQILFDNLKECRLNKKWHKNNINKNIRWIK